MLIISFGIVVLAIIDHFQFHFGVEFAAVT